jgi:leucine dehydrogenase
MNKNLSIKELLEKFEQLEITFAYVVRRENKLIVSDERLGFLRDLIEQPEIFADHEAVFIGRDPRFKTLFFAFIHNTTRGLAQGGLRVTEYDDVAAVIRDGLRLSQGMTRKNAVCEIWWGGGKGIIPITKELVDESFGGDKYLHKPKNEIEDKEENRSSMRNELFQAYGEFVARLGGVYYTAEDIGTTKGDMKAILSRNRFVTCIPEDLGGSGDPGKHTAKGVFLAIETAWRHLHPESDGNLENVRVAVQGAGHVGEALIKNLIDAKAKVWVSDISWEGDGGEEKFAEFKKSLKESFRDEFQKDFPDANFNKVDCGEGHKNDIFEQDVEIVAPCAKGGVVNSQIIENFKPSVELLCGGANNILENEAKEGEQLHKKNILFVPDFACNWMGIFNCANEWMGYLEEDIKTELGKVDKRVSKILEKAKDEKISSTKASHMFADEAIENPPLRLLVGRGQRIIEHVVHKFEEELKKQSEAN